MKAGKILAAALGTGALVLTVTGNVMYNIALKAHGNRSAIFKAEENQSDKEPGSGMDYESIDFKDAWTASKFDGLTLHANVIERDSDTWVIAMHGYSLNGKVIYEKCTGWNERGYSLLCPDMRGHGESEGDYVGMGWHDRFDIVSWAEYINEKYSPENIVLYGVSMGAAAVMMAAGEKLPGNVKCAVEDCGYATVKEEFRHEGKAVFHVPYYPFVWAGSIVTKIRAGWSFEEASAVNQLKKATVPVMFIHGDKDKFVPVSHAYEAYEACTSEKKLCIVEGASHAEAQDEAPEEYWSNVFEFTDRFI